MSTVKNNHFVSKYLVRPWEHSSGKLKLFNYRSSEYEDGETEKLFAKNGIFSQDQETFFNKYVETISRQELSSLTANGYKAKKWKNYRALLLLMWDLIGRYIAATSGDSAAVHFFTGFDEKGLDQMALAIEQQYTLMFATVPASGRLFFPSNVILFAFDPSTAVCNFGVPFNGHQILFNIKKGSNIEYLHKLCENHTFCNLSAGNYTTDFVLVHPDVPLDEKLKSTLIELRENNQALANQISELRGKLAEAFNKFGLT